MSGTGLIQVKIQEKVDAIPGERVRAVGMCFYKPVKELSPGSSYRLCRNAQTHEILRASRSKMERASEQH